MSNHFIGLLNLESAQDLDDVVLCNVLCGPKTGVTDGTAVSGGMVVLV